MNNIFFAIQNIAINIQHTILLFFKQQITWGFVLGFFTATMIHLFVISDNAAHLRTVIRHDPGEAFTKMSEQSKEGTFHSSFFQFKKEYDRIRFIFSIAILVFFLVIAVTLLNEWV